MHRRVLQRAFPSAFRLEALPLFDEISANSNSPLRSVVCDASVPHLNQVAVSSASIEVHQRRRRRKRLQSLMELTFDHDPVPPFGSCRLCTYKELKTKIERDREIGTRTIGGLHAAMLKQVAGISDTKVLAILDQYPTMCHLLRAYDGISSLSDQERRNFLKDLPLGDPSLTRDARLGERASAEITVSYGMINSDDDSSREGGKSASVALSNSLAFATSIYKATPSSIQVDSGEDLLSEESHYTPYKVVASKSTSQPYNDEMIENNWMPVWNLGDDGTVSLAPSVNKTLDDAPERARSYCDKHVFLKRALNLASSNVKGLATTAMGLHDHRGAGEQGFVPLKRYEMSESIDLTASPLLPPANKFHAAVASCSKVSQEVIEID
jgi:hypothetical protein